MNEKIFKLSKIFILMYCLLYFIIFLINTFVIITKHYTVFGSSNFYKIMNLIFLTIIILLSSYKFEDNKIKIRKSNFIFLLVISIILYKFNFFVDNFMKFKENKEMCYYYNFCNSSSYEFTFEDTIFFFNLEEVKYSKKEKDLIKPLNKESLKNKYSLNKKGFPIDVYTIEDYYLITINKKYCNSSDIVYDNKGNTFVKGVGYSPYSSNCLYATTSKEISNYIIYINDEEISI